MPFTIDSNSTYERKLPRGEQRQQRTWVSTLGPGLDKRQCTLQICFAPEGPPVRSGIIFRGTGKRVSTDEKNAFHKDVDVYWQANAWACSNFIFVTLFSISFSKTTCFICLQHCHHFLYTHTTLTSRLHQNASQQFVFCLHLLSCLVHPSCS